MTSWRDPPGIEPLSDTSWKRIERGLFADLDRAPAPETERRWRWRPWFGVAAAAVAVAALALIVLQSSDESTPRQIHPRVATGDAPSQLTVGRATLEVAPHSALWVNAGQEVTVMLEKGEVECTVPPRPNDQPFVVQAGDVRVEVVGTRFSVGYEEGSVSVEVSEGVVQVFHDGEQARVEAGERWPREQEESAEALEDVVSEDPKTVEADDAGSEPVKTKRRRGSKLSLKDRYNTAASLEASDPEAAIAIYRELARKRGPWAANALYARARLEVERGNVKVARKLLRRYLERYRRGANAADAKALLDQLE